METHIEGTATNRYGATVATGRQRKNLNFSLSGEDYGFLILKVKEIIGMMSITSVPGAPEYVKGMGNLRGKVTPVVDLRLKFGFKVPSYTDRTCIIVVEIRGQNGQLLMGNEADSVSDVLNIKGCDIDEAMAAAMKNEISADGTTLTIFIGKRFDITTFEAFRETYKEKMDAISSVNIDMTDCAYIDNSALSMLLMMRERFSGDKANIFIANISPNVKKILLAANFDKLFKIES
jgi:anti-anti-sigma factor